MLCGFSFAVLDKGPKLRILHDPVLWLWLEPPVAARPVTPLLEDEFRLREPHAPWDGPIASIVVALNAAAAHVSEVALAAFQQVGVADIAARVSGP